MFNDVRFGLLETVRSRPIEVSTGKEAVCRSGLSSMMRSRPTLVSTGKFKLVQPAIFLMIKSWVTDVSVAKAGSAQLSTTTSGEGGANGFTQWLLARPSPETV